MLIRAESEKFRLAEAFTISRGTKTEAEVVTARVGAAWGECVPYARYGETLESVTAQIEGLPAGIDRVALQEALPAGAARNAVDCALWDLEAKMAGQRAWDLAGLSAPGPEVTAYTLSLDTPDKMEAQAAENAYRPLLKTKLGGENDVPRIEAVRRGGTGDTLWVRVRDATGEDELFLRYADGAPLDPALLTEDHFIFD